VRNASRSKHFAVDTFEAPQVSARTKYAIQLSKIKNFDLNIKVANQLHSKKMVSKPSRTNLMSSKNIRFD